MKAKPYRAKSAGGTLRECTPSEASHVWLCTPTGNHLIRVSWKDGDTVEREKGYPCWEWNGDVDRPTITPSILCVRLGKTPRNHFFIREGNVQYLTDCEHEYAGKTIPLLDVDM